MLLAKDGAVSENNGYSELKPMNCAYACDFIMTFTTKQSLTVTIGQDERVFRFAECSDLYPLPFYLRTYPSLHDKVTVNHMVTPSLHDAG